MGQMRNNSSWFLALGAVTLFSTSRAIPTATASISSSTANFAPGVTPPPNQPLPPLNCPTPTQAYCYWEPDIVKDEYYTCWRSWILYTSSSNSVLFSSTRSWTKTYTLTATTGITYSTTWDPDVEFSTLCDGHARAPSGATPDIVTSTVTIPLTTPRISLSTDPETDYLPWPTQPPCRIPQKQCASLSSAWNSMSDGFWNGYYTSNIPLGLWHEPHCTVDYTAYYPAPTCLPGSVSSRIGCQLYQDDLTMLYWPVTTAAGNFCGQNGTLVTNTPTLSGQPNTVVYEGATLTSPSVYMVINSARALQTKWTTVPYGTNTSKAFTTRFWCASTLSSLTLTLHPSEVTKSYWARGTQLETTRFNFNDLNTLPYSAYSDEVCGWGMFRNEIHDDCKTMWGDYHPTISVPASLTEKSSGWEGCEVVQLATVGSFIPLAPVPDVAKERGNRTVPATVSAMPTVS